ncbi:MAG: methyltransferase family protein [Alphaproteobacteria bacterium]
MRIHEQLESQGAVLFRWRSFLPLFLVPVAIPALIESVAVDAIIGEEAEDAWTVFCLGVSFLGLMLRWVTIAFVPAGTSGRNTREQRAHQLNTTGVYSTVRNPLYLGNFVALFGIALATKCWWFAVIVCLAYWLYIERIVAAEEKFLDHAFPSIYADYAARTPAFVPRLGLWTGPAESFSLRTVLCWEYNGVLSVVAAFVALELITDVLMEHEGVRAWMEREWWWVTIGALALVLFSVLRGLKKRTRVLHVPGR